MNKRSPCKSWALIWALFIAGLLATLLSGCASHQTQVRFDTPSGSVRGRLPKDAQIGWLEITHGTGTNALRVTFSNCVFRMNPEVLKAQSEREAAIARAAAQGAATAIKLVP